MTQLPFGVPRCAICEAAEARWSHQLDPRLSQFRVHGKGHVWGSPVAVCDACEAMLRTHDTEGLLAVAVDCEREAIAALVAADLGGVSVDTLLPAGHRELVAEGFVPLEQITGADHLGAAWPEAHRRQLGDAWFVRSPWPDLELAAVFELVIATVDATIDTHGARVSDDEINGAVRELLANEDEVRRRLGG